MALIRPVLFLLVFLAFNLPAGASEPSAFAASSRSEAKCDQRRKPGNGRLAKLQPGERLWAAIKVREARIEDYSGGMPC